MDNTQQLSYEELLAKVAQLEREKVNKASKGLSMKIGEKGGLSVYGLGRFPVTLYMEQWLRLLDKSQDIRDYLEANKAHLAVKADKAEAKA